MENIAYIKTLFVTTVTDHLIIKTLASIAFTIGTFLFAGLSTKALVALLVLIVIDYVVAIWHAKQNNELISSKLSLKTPIKMLVYYTMIASGHMVEYGLPEPMQYLDDTMLTFLLVTELISILKHFGNLGYKTPSKLINNLKEQIGEKDVVESK